MFDLIYLFLIGALFSLGVGYISFCDSLQRKESIK